MPAAAPAAPGRPPTPQLIEQGLDSGAIGRDAAALYTAYALGRPAKLPAAYRSSTPWDGTLPLLDLRAAVKRMNPGPRRKEVEGVLAAQSAGSCGSSNGNLASETQTPHFYVQYGSIGAGLSIGGYLDSLEGSWVKEVDAFGWAAPPVDSNPAPGGKYHVRIDNLSGGLYGYVSSSGTYAGAVGDNPSTPWNDSDAYASCMVLNDDYTGFPSAPQASLDSTTAHEFNHSLQFGYGALTGGNAANEVLTEGGATWMEDEVYDSADDNHNYLWPAFHQSLGDYDGSPYPYWIAFRGLTERYGTGVAGGGEQVMQDFWEETSRGTGNNLTALQTALANRGTTLAAAFHAYAIAVKFNRACGGGYVYPYCFEEGPAYLAEAGDTLTHKTIANVGDTASTQVEDNYALNWVRLPAAGHYAVQLENTSSGGQLRGTVACDTGSALLLSPLPATVSSEASAVLSRFDAAACSSAPVLVVTNQAQTAANPTSSSERSYAVSTMASAPPTRPPPGVDDNAPAQGRLRLSPRRFRAARTGPSATPAAIAGTRVAYSLSERATTVFRIQRAVAGRMVGGRCVKATPFNGDRRRCTRYVLMRGRFRRAGHAGGNSFRFRGRLAGRALRPRRYRLLARSTDAAGNRSAIRRARFRIIG